MVFFLMLIPIGSGSASDMGHYKLILRTGVILWLVGIFTTSACHKYWQFLLAQGACIGIANGLLFVPTMSVVSTYFDPSRRSLAIGIILCGSATGGMIFPIMLNRFFGTIGFGWAVRSFGFMALVLLLLAERLLKKRLPPKDSAKFFEPGELKDIVFVLFVSMIATSILRVRLILKDRWLFPQLQRVILRVLLRQRVCAQQTWHDAGGDYTDSNGFQRRWRTWAAHPNVHGRPVVSSHPCWPSRQPCNSFTALRLSRRQVNDIDVCLRSRVWAVRLCSSGALSGNDGRPNRRSKEDGHTVWYGLCIIKFWRVNWKSSRRRAD